jgi:agmatine/peptidylarginine deiminase
MSTISNVNGIRVQSAADGMVLVNSDGDFAKEVVLSENSEEWSEVVDDREEETTEIVDSPNTISKLQAVALLVQMGRYEELMTELGKDTTGVSKILFDAASVLSRDSNMVNQLASALDMSSADVDNFFVEANKILI